MHNNFDGHWLQKLASRNPIDLAICNSEFTRSTLQAVYPATPSFVIYNPVKPSAVPVGARDALRRQLNVAPETAVVLMASRMEAWKGHLNLIRAAEKLETKNDWAIWIAGAPQTSREKKYFSLLNAEVHRRHLEGKVLFLGFRSDVPALMRAADIYCQPNAEPEPFGVVFVEALQAGVPIVTFEMGGPREILTKSSGILVPPGNIDALANALARVIDDASLRATLGAQGPVRARELCDPAQQIRRVHEVLWDFCYR
jgi:glycosyltransferase involved in cell wall biosynthesis